MIPIQEFEIEYGLHIMRRARTFDRHASFGLRLRLRLYRAMGVRLFTRRDVAKLLIHEATPKTRGRKRAETIRRIAR